jgi:hypothetical protein
VKEDANAPLRPYQRHYKRIIKLAIRLESAYGELRGRARRVKKEESWI